MWCESQPRLSTNTAGSVRVALAGCGYGIAVAGDSEISHVSLVNGRNAVPGEL